MKKSLIRVIGFSFIFILLFSNLVLSIGISPSRQTIYYEPGVSKKFDFYVVNRDSQPLDFIITSRGDFTQYMTHISEQFILEPGEKKFFNLTLDMPAEYNTPGDHKNELIAQEVIPREWESGTIGTTTAIISLLYVRVPYEGPYLGSSFKASSVSIGEPLTFFMKLENLGSVALPSIDGKISIFNSKEELVDSIEFEESLQLNEIKQIKQYWDTSSALADSYTAKLELVYEGKTLEKETEFKLGDVFIDIIDYQKDLVAGKINKYVATIESGWSNSVEEVYVNLKIDNHGDEYVYKSESFTLDPWEKREITMYVDATELEAGEYPAQFGVYYEGLSNVKDFKIRITDSVNYLIITGFSLLILVILALLIYIFIIRKKKKSSRKK